MILCVKQGRYELTVKHSRFIALSYLIDSRDDVKRIVDGLKSEYIDARHICYGYIADEKGDDFGYDDNGEPNGTAGKPIYSALAACGAKKSMIAVVRYFGGIKLGASGLTRAYRQSAANLIQTVGVATVERQSVYRAECDGDVYKRAATPIGSLLCTVEHIVYGSTVTYTISVPTDNEDEMLSALGRIGVSLTKIGERLVDKN